MAMPYLSLQIWKEEIFTLPGSSGRGKTMLLRMIAGFNTIERGSLRRVYEAGSILNEYA